MENPLISLVINSKDPVQEWLDKAIESGHVFDEIIIYIDGETDFPCFSRHVKVVSDGQSRDIKDGFNFAVSHASGIWICSFCDDDYFLQGNLMELISEIKAGRFNHADIIHFPVITESGIWGASSDFSLEMIMDNNVCPHGSFIRKIAFDLLGGYKINPGADWNLWLRAKKAGCVFKGYDKPIYNFRMGHPRSAWRKQISELGFDQIKREVLNNA